MLALVFKEGDEFTVAQTLFVVKELREPNMAILRDDLGIEYTITDDMSEEVLADVFVSLGKASNTATNIKLAFDAPRSIPIFRGKNRDVGPVAP